MPLQRHTTLPIQASWIILGLSSDSPQLPPLALAAIVDLTKVNLLLKGVPGTGKGGQVEFIAHLLT
jgi:hypothetical protein